MDKIEQQIDKCFNEVNSKMDAKFDDVHRRLEIGNKHFHTLTALEHKVETLNNALLKHMEDELVVQKETAIKLEKQEEKISVIHDDTLVNKTLIKILMSGMGLIIALLIKLAFFGT